jgi:hypothetical protein
MHNIVKGFFSMTERMTIYRCVILLVLLLSSLLASCTSSKLDIYENQESGIWLEKPGNWDISYNERNGMTSLRAEQGIWNKDAASILIFGFPCQRDDEGIRDMEVEFESAISRLRTVYSLDSITIIQNPFMYQVGEYEYYRASIEIPSSAFKDTSDEKAIEEKDQDSFRTVDLFRVYDEDGASIYIEVYEGESVELNTQAYAIVESIQLFCPMDLE